jgi:hypothetical protein
MIFLNVHKKAVDYASCHYNITQIWKFLAVSDLVLQQIQYILSG